MTSSIVQNKIADIGRNQGKKEREISEAGQTYVNPEKK